jgi:hypothetical protein
MKEFFIRIFSLIIFIYTLIAFAYNMISTIIFTLMMFGLFVLFLMTDKFKVAVPADRWRLFAMIGSITTAVSLLINANIFIRNEKVQGDQNLINFNKIVSDSFGKIDDTFIKYPDRLGYLYHDIYYSSGHPLISDLEKYRDKNLEFQQAFSIFQAMEVTFIAGKLDENKDKPEFRGILNTIDMFASSNLMRDYWKTIKFNFSPKFIKFLEDEYFNNRLSTDKVFVT